MVSQDTHLIYAVVPAAGVGSRMKADLPKQYLRINNKTILEHTVDKLLAHPLVDKVVIAVSEADPYFPQLSLSQNKRVVRVLGGKERSESVFSCLDHIVNQLKSPDSWVLVHDAARPCVRYEDIDNLIHTAGNSEVGGILAVPVRDTMKRSDHHGAITQTVERNHLWHALTPQMFRAKPLMDALDSAHQRGEIITDDASAMELLGLKPLLIMGRSDNFKVTQPEDLALAEFYLNNEEKHTDKRNMR